MECKGLGTPIRILGNQKKRMANDMESGSTVQVRTLWS